MLKRIDSFRATIRDLGLEITTPDIVQILTEDELIELLPRFDGWIIGDDPATRRVFEAGVAGKLKAAVKWGAGVDNVDFAACKDLGIPVINTPGMFGREVADIALGYVIALARHTFEIDRLVKAGSWVKPPGISLAGKTVGLVGYGDIGRNVAKRLHVADMNVIVYDPFCKPDDAAEIKFAKWPESISELDFIVFTCALTETNRHMLGGKEFAMVKSGVRVINVARGPLIDEGALIDAFAKGVVHSAALDVFEIEPLPSDSQLRELGDRCIFGSHNSSNTIEAVERTSLKALELIAGFLGSAAAH